MVISGADPLNLVGILTQHPRVISTASNRVAYLNGKPLAALQGGEVLRFTDIPRELEKVLAEKFRLEFMEDAILVPEAAPTETRPPVVESPPATPPSVAGAAASPNEPTAPSTPTRSRDRGFSRESMTASDQRLSLFQRR